MDNKKLNIDPNMIQSLISLVIQLIGLLPTHERAKAMHHLGQEIGRQPRAD